MRQESPAVIVTHTIQDDSTYILEDGACVYFQIRPKIERAYVSYNFYSEPEEYYSYRLNGKRIGDDHSLLSHKKDIDLVRIISVLYHKSNEKDKERFTGIKISYPPTPKDFIPYDYRVKKKWTSDEHQVEESRRCGGIRNMGIWPID